MKPKLRKRNLFFASVLLAIFTVQASIPYKQCAVIPVNSDTISIPYTYWWPSGGPFTGLCGNEYSMVFTGTLLSIDPPTGPFPTGRNIGEVLYHPQAGVIGIREMLYVRPPFAAGSATAGKAYNNEKYFKSECFYDLALKPGDKVIVFVYSYEGDYAIPPKSILKIKEFNSLPVQSVKKYISGGMDPLKLEPDTNLWEEYGLKEALKQIIRCRTYQPGNE